MRSNQRTGSRDSWNIWKPVYKISCKELWWENARLSKNKEKSFAVGVLTYDNLQKANFTVVKYYSPLKWWRFWCLVNSKTVSQKTLQTITGKKMKTSLTVFLISHNDFDVKLLLTITTWKGTGWRRMWRGSPPGYGPAESCDPGLQTLSTVQWSWQTAPLLWQHPRERKAWSYGQSPKGRRRGRASIGSARQGFWSRVQLHLQTRGPSPVES